MKYDEKLLREVIEIAVSAGKEIMKVYSRDFSVEYKDDSSPLTEADKVSNDVIAAELSNLDRQYPVLSEESNDVGFSERKDWGIFWLIDPLDGTKEFIKKNDEFTVNIALIENGSPVLGVVHAPALGITYYGMKGYGAYRKTGDVFDGLPCEKNYGKVIRVVASRSHMNRETANFIEAISDKHPDCGVETVSKGSSLKLCMVADGTADYYPRLAPTMEWDTAAAQCVVEAAGKNVFTYESFELSLCSGEKLVYNKENQLNPFFIVV